MPAANPKRQVISLDQIVQGDARALLTEVEPFSVDLSFWSPPYHVGKSYEQGNTFEDWQDLLREVIALHTDILRPGGFLAINIGDILCFPDPAMPRFQSDNINGKGSPCNTGRCPENEGKAPRSKPL